MGLLQELAVSVPPGFVLEDSDGLGRVAHRDGVPWFDAPKPRRWHRCKAQTIGWVGLRGAERCACGAIKWADIRGWGRKNERRTNRSQTAYRCRQPECPVCASV